VDDEFLADAADRIKNSINRADGIIRGLLSFSRQAGIDLKLGNISEVLNESVALVSHQLTRRNIRVVRDFASVAPTRFDRNQMKQVFINLLLNAIEAIEHWGEINIELRESPEESREVMIRVSDNGCGMNRDTASRIFDPFFTTKRNSGGTGLGMSISKGIIEKHNGRISVESAVGAGTQVSIFLPQGAVH
jgi:signal transduction histidine kinase